MRTVKSDIAYKERASRLELLVRIVYMIPAVVVLLLMSFLAGLAEFILWFHILIFGKRHESLNKVVAMYINYRFRINAYLNLLTDERPPIIPET
jgi:ABC-type maltose transport system permease subunit